MNARLLLSLVAALALGLVAATAQADTIVTHTLQNGSSGGVSYSWLSRGTTIDGTGADELWRISGTVTVTYDDTTGNITGMSGTIDIFDNVGTGYYTNHVGTATLQGADLHDPGDFDWTSGDGGTLGYIDVTFSVDADEGSSTFSTHAGSVGTVRIGFADRDYGAQDGEFNNFTQNLITLWGDELLNGTHADTAANFGFDWYSTAPEPGSLLLLASGLAGIAVVRRRRKTA